MSLGGGVSSQEAGYAYARLNHSAFVPALTRLCLRLDTLSSSICTPPSPPARYKAQSEVVTLLSNTRTSTGKVQQLAVNLALPFSENTIIHLLGFNPLIYFWVFFLKSMCTYSLYRADYGKCKCFKCLKCFMIFSMYKRSV